nr:DUF4158 domain-containing protein [Pelomonas sp. P8]
MPREMSADDVRQYCPLSKDQIDQIRAASGRQEQNLLALAVQVVSLASTGKQPEKTTALPPALLKFLCAELNVYRVAPSIAALKTIYDSEHILRRHREVARAIAGFQPVDDSLLAELSKMLAARPIDAASVDGLYTPAEQWLYDQQRVIPANAPCATWRTRPSSRSRTWHSAPSVGRIAAAAQDDPEGHVRRERGPQRHGAGMAAPVRWQAQRQEHPSGVRTHRLPERTGRGQLGPQCAVHQPHSGLCAADRAPAAI